MKQKGFLYVLMLLIAVFAVSAVMAQDDADPAPAAAVAAPAPADGAQRVTGGLVALYQAADVTGGILLPDKGGAQEPLDLIRHTGEAPSQVSVTENSLVFSKQDVDAKPPGFFSAHPADGIMRAVQGTGEISVEAWVTPAIAAQQGPARIVTISRNTTERNFTLGHNGTSFAARLRTSSSTPSGTPELVTPAGTIEADTLYHVVFTFDGIWLSIYVNGEMVAESNELAGSFESWDPEMLLGLGNEINGDRLWSGALHLAAIYNIALDEDEVAQNFAAGF